MVIPKRHILSIGEESKEELAAREEILSIATKTLMKLYPKSGFEIFIQIGEGSDRSFKHTHWHITPASVDDVFRGTEKMSKFYTTKKDEQKILLFPVEIHLAKEKLQSALRDLL